jgi:hypothetical protein
MLLASVYPEYNWLPWKFSQCPKNFWDSIENQKKFVEWAAKELKINEKDNWYRVTYNVK